MQRRVELRRDVVTASSPGLKANDLVISSAYALVLGTRFSRSIAMDLLPPLCMGMTKLAFHNCGHMLCRRMALNILVRGRTNSPEHHRITRSFTRQAPPLSSPLVR
ncbi:hypothetical protein E2C01_038436 [Portunus trituberculatus]|uniref:Uncharacterized protein n=1 Tax=Portunus trituberculatus TaxID=210409 RepID=A0A5B7FH86_PORTR|nr:hypothetical protein [Portunus trituberculatus]